MKPKKSNRNVIVGIFILLGLTILMVTIFTLGGQKKTFAKTFPVYAIFNDVSGLQSGGNIWFSGVKVGTVKKISFHGDSQVQVTMHLEKEAQPFIHQDAKVKIGSDGLIGNKIIIIYGGTTTAPQVEEDDFLAIENALGTDDMLATLQVTNKNLETITNDFKSISKKIDSGEGTLGSLINDPSLANKLDATVSDLQATMTNFKLVSENSKLVLSDVQAFTGKINSPGNSINDIVTDTQIYSTLIGTVTELRNAANSLGQFTGNLNHVSERLNQSNSPVGVILNDPSAAASIQNTLKKLETSSVKLDENLEALQHNFLLRRFFKKKEKEEKKEKEKEEKEKEKSD